MALFKNTFTLSGEGAVASYDALDISKGSAIATFYGADHGSNTKILYPSVVYSNIGYTQGTVNTAQDLDFDVLIDVPIIIEGKAVVAVPMLIGATSGGSAAHDCTVTAYIRKYSGVTETDLDNEAYMLDDVTVAGANNATYRLVVLGLDIPYTKFKAGDYLRVTVTTSVIGANIYTGIFHDPESRTPSTLVPSTVTLSAVSWAHPVLKALIPVVIDL
jgi:hypothetical protein